MTEIVEPSLLDHPPRRTPRLRVSDIVILGIVALVIIGLGWFIIGRITLKHDVSAARIVSDKTIADLQKRDGSAARKLGTTTFQKTYSDTQLTKQFKAVEIATLKAPSLDRTIVSTGKKGRTVFFVYRYNALKVPFYIRVGIVGKSGVWKLTDITGNADESTLLFN